MQNRIPATIYDAQQNPTTYYFVPNDFIYLFENCVYLLQVYVVNVLLLSLILLRAAAADVVDVDMPLFISILVVFELYICR